MRLLKNVSQNSKANSILFYQMNPKDISISDYSYPLPKEKIAVFPLKKRDQSKLLVFEQGKIVEDGSHQELVKTGIYKRLWETQVGGFFSDQLNSRVHF